MNIIKNLKWYFNKQLFPSSKKCKHWTVYRIPNGEPTTIFANITDLTDVRVPQQTVTLIAPDVTLMSYDLILNDMLMNIPEGGKLSDVLIINMEDKMEDIVSSIEDHMAKQNPKKPMI